ncbi:penicillin-binding protein [Nanchangia anserum]|uniref:Penicillin-binding protein n=1 Tax=Nanchangia anserum TaxID=2692125 RepID=A0A8I0G9C3_9ACTO|nr:transglycosylase domain-containing protein [Nanchangia anserum]MBD3689549.1 penicillin-binding protein [Nanchangia anserum]QOX81737.1 penicillin-binding protein [Nanchangia anserum]
MPKTPRTLPRGELTRLLTAIGLLIVAMAVLFAGLAIPAVGTLGMISRAGTATFNELPDEFEPVPPSEQSVVLAADGSTIAHFYAQNRRVVSLDDMSPWVRKAIVAIEDHRFYDHHGVDLEGNLRAVANNLAGGSMQGASTLTQQYVKNTLIEIGLQSGDDQAVRDAKAPTIQRKLREAKYATSVEKKYSKDEILAGYLNIAPFGPSVYGVEAASQHYFSKPAKDLTLAEGALLAGLTQSPSAYDPLRFPDEAQKRRDLVLSAMLGYGDITQAEYDEARAISVPDMLKPSDEPQGCAAAGSAGYFCSYVVNEIYNNEIYGKTLQQRRNLLLRGGLTIHTTLDPNAQQAAQKAIEEQVPKNDPSNTKIALASIEPGTGKIIALAQNTTFGVAVDKDPTATEVSFAVDKEHGGGAGYQTGSSYKIFTLAAWLDAGKSAYASVGGRSSYDQSEFTSTCPEAASSSWSFKNSNSMSTAATSVITATQKSLNSGFASMASELDLCSIMRMAKDTGAVPGDGTWWGTAKGKIPFTPAAILGSGSVPPLSMANAYATFINDGTYCTPIAISAVEDRDGKALKVPDATCHQTVKPETAQKVTRVLNMTYQSYGGQTAIGRPAMTKTGTTDEAEAAWLVGGVPQLATAVWVGHSEGSAPLTNVWIGGRYYRVVFGSTIPSAAWRNYMAAATANMEVRDFSSVNLGGSSSRGDAAIARKRAQQAREESERQAQEQEKQDGEDSEGGDD